MIGSKITARIGEKTGPEGVHVQTEIDDNMTAYEMLAAAGSLVTDCIEVSGGKLDVENFVTVIRRIHNKDF